MSSMLDGGGPIDSNQQSDLIVCTLKLFAVRDKDKKLIGVVNFTVDW